MDDAAAPFRISIDSMSFGLMSAARFVAAVLALKSLGLVDVVVLSIG